MKKDYSKLFMILQWVFVATCAFLAIGMGLNVGTIFVLLAAIMALPIKPIQGIWNKLLRVEEIENTEEQDNLKWWQFKAKSAQKQIQSKVENNKRKKAMKPLIISLVFLFAIIFGAATMDTAKTPIIADPADSSAIVSSQTTQESETEPETETSATDATSSKETQAATEKPTSKPQESVNFDLSSIPAFSNKPYVAINNNIPYFTDSELTLSSFENYSSLDTLSRCGVAYACIGTDIMPTEERGSIGSVKPTGWHTIKYDNVDGKYLYNRCHLIGYQLSGENANNKNLITGTRYLNVDGMLPFENMVADYVKETNNHVLYRVTPIFSGNNLVASGVLMEAKSVEDKGEGILFCVYCYNNQPGISIDYATGESSSTGGTVTESPATEKVDEPVADNPTEQTYILNTNTKKFHNPDCASAKKIKDENKQTYSGSRDDLIAQGYDPCKNCNP